MSGAELTLVFVTITIASCLQGAIGFGVGLLAAPVVVLVDPTLLPGMLVLLTAGITVLGVARDRSSIDLRGAGWAFLGRLPGTVLGALLVAVLPPRGLALTLAGTVLLGVLLSVRGWRPEPRPLTVVTAGAASGLLGTATSIGGPPMALVWHESSAARLRGTMSAFFLIGALFSIAALLVVEAIDWRIFRLTALLAPAVLLGFLLSRLVNRHLNRQRVRRIALVASTLGALLVLAGAM